MSSGEERVASVLGPSDFSSNEGVRGQLSIPVDRNSDSKRASFVRRSHIRCNCDSKEVECRGRVAVRLHVRDSAGIHPFSGEKVECGLYPGTPCAIGESGQGSLKLSTIISPVEIAWVQKRYDLLFVNFNFVLADEDGEIHAPKDQDRREMILGHVRLIRQHVVSDVQALSEKRCQLSPGW